jgi:hypothetical protein
MAQSRQTQWVWSDAIRGSEILANCVKLGTSAVVLRKNSIGELPRALWFAIIRSAPSGLPSLLAAVA